MTLDPHTVEKVVELVTKRVLLMMAEEQRAAQTGQTLCTRECDDGLCVQMCFDRVSAVRMRIGPSKVPSKFLGSQFTEPVSLASMVNGASLMLHDDFPEHGHPPAGDPACVMLHLQVNDPDAWWNRAVDAGATAVLELADQFWGDRYGQIEDPFGHRWSIGAPSAPPPE